MPCLSDSTHYERDQADRDRIRCVQPCSQLKESHFSN